MWNDDQLNRRLAIQKMMIAGGDQENADAFGSAKRKSTTISYRDVTIQDLLRTYALYS